MKRRKTAGSIKTRAKSIFVCMGVLFFFCLSGKEKIAANTGGEWEFEIYQSEGREYADLTAYNNENVEITIPQYVQDKMGKSYPVGRITGFVKEQKDFGIKRIDIPSKIGHITLGKRSLAGCESLEEVEAGCNIEIEEQTFLGCKNLKKITCQKELFAHGTSIDTFAGCENLAEIVVCGDKIRVEGGVFDSIPRDCSLILEDTVKLQVKEDFSRGNVNLVCYKNVSSKENIELVVKNGYFYNPEAMIENLVILPREKLYAITSSPIFTENKEISIDIVAGIEVGNVRNKAFYTAKDKERKITVKDLKIVTDGKEDAIKITCYAPSGQITRYIEQWQDNETVTDYSKGAVLLCEPLKAGEVQSPIIAYSGKKYILGEIQGHNALPTQLDIQLAENAHLVEGMKEELVSNQLLVTVLFDNGVYREILSEEDYELTLEDGCLKAGQKNILLVTTKKDYEITGRLFGVEAAKKQLVSGSAIYVGSTDKETGTVWEGTKPDVDKFSVLAAYDNGEIAYLENPSITLLFEEVILGENLYDILCDGCKMSVKITGVPNRVQSITVQYKEDWLPVGGYIDVDKIQFEIIRESGKREEVQSYTIQEYQIVKGENTIGLCYTGNLPFVSGVQKTVELEVLGADEKEIITEVYLIEEDLQITPDSIVDAGFFGVRQIYQGKTVIIKNPEIFILPYELKEGENILQLQYKGKIYPTSVWAEQKFPIDTQEPQKPTIEPQEATTEPVEPTIEPLKPTTEPVEPTIEPLKPTTEPVEPTTEPVEPTIEPSEPTTEPVEPTIEPSKPTIESQEPTTEPTELIIEPVEPIVKPSEPIAESPKPSIEPSNVPDNNSFSEPISKMKFLGEISIAGTGKIKFQNSEKISYGVCTNEPVTIAFSLQKIKKIQWQFVEKGKNYKENAWKTLKGTIWNYHKNITNCALYIQVTDINGTKKMKKTNGFTIDMKRPAINIVNKKTYLKGFSIKATDKGSGIKKITLNGKKVSNGKKINKKGKYRICVWDRAGNYIWKEFFVS